MNLVDVQEVRHQLRLEDDFPSELLQPYADAAEVTASAYLGRRVYMDAAERDESVVSGVSALTTARLAYETAQADTTLTPEQVGLALAQYAEARLTARRTVFGLVINHAVRSAMVMIAAHLFSNATGVDVAGRLVGIPAGAKALLDLYRLPSMP